MNTVAKNIKRLRIQNSMTQEQLAEKMYVTRQTISKWETEKARPDIDTLSELANVFSTDIYDLIYGYQKEGYKRFQTKYFVVSLVCLVGIIVTKTFSEFLAGILSGVGFRRQYTVGLLVPFFSYLIIGLNVGVMLLSLLSLWFDIKTRNRWLVGIVCISALFPTIMLIAEITRGIVERSFSGCLLYNSMVLIPWTRFIVVWLLPTISGMFLFMYYNNPPQGNRRIVRESLHELRHDIKTGKYTEEYKTICVHLSSDKVLRFCTVLLMLFVFTLSVFTGAFLHSTYKYVSNNEEYNISMRTLLVSKDQRHFTDARFSEHDCETILSMENTVAVFPALNRFFCKIDIPEAENGVRTTANLVGVDIACLPVGFQFDGYSYDSFAKNGVLLPDTIVDQDKREINTDNLIGTSITFEITQYDYSVEVDPTEGPPITGKQQIEFIIMGVYDSDRNLGLQNQVFIASENIELLSDIFWNGYMTDESADHKPSKGVSKC